MMSFTTLHYVMKWFILIVLRIAICIRAAITEEWVETKRFKNRFFLVVDELRSITALNN